GDEGTQMELELLLRTGRVKDVREWADPEVKAALGIFAHWLRAQALAASGDYALAREELEHLEAAAGGGPESNPRERMALQIGRWVLNEQPVGVDWPHLPWRAAARAEVRGPIQSAAERLRQEADVRVVLGLLALEQGDADEAEVAFRLALAVWHDGAGLDFSARPVAEGYLRWLEGAAKVTR